MYIADPYLENMRADIQPQHSVARVEGPGGNHTWLRQKSEYSSASDLNDTVSIRVFKVNLNTLVK